MNVWNIGADGIHTFNAWTFHVDLLGEERANKRAYVPLWKEIGNPETLGKLDKIYASTHANNNVDAWYGKGTSEKYRQFPTQLAAGQRANRSIRVYEDVSSADLKLRIRLSGVSQDRLPKLSFKFNGQVLESLEAVPVPESPRFPNEIWLETKTEAELIRNGQNDIEVTVGGSVVGGDEPMMLAGLQLHVRHSLA